MITRGFTSRSTIGVTFNIVWKLVHGDGNPSLRRPTVLEVESACGMIARFEASSSSLPVPWRRWRINAADQTGKL